MTETIGNPVTWIAKIIGRGAHFAREGVVEIVGEDKGPIVLNQLHIADLKSALQKGLDDFGALRTDVMFIVVMYPIIGLLMVNFTLNHNLLPLLFPLVSGFALVGPVAAIGLYAMSRKREHGLPTSWGDAFSVITSPSFIPIATLAGYLFAIFVLWMLSAFFLYGLTLGPEPPASLQGFLNEIFFTPNGWVMLIAGVVVGFVFAALVLAVSLVSFPLLVDRHVGLTRAVLASVQLVRENLMVAALWGVIVVVGIGLGVVTLFVGLIVTLPVLGHATWHLYRRAIVSTELNGTS